jgi:uncharacterized ParB-like nuclease family protein
VPAHLRVRADGLEALVSAVEGHAVGRAALMSSLAAALGALKPRPVRCVSRDGRLRFARQARLRCVDRAGRNHRALLGPEQRWRDRYQWMRETPAAS